MGILNGVAEARGFATSQADSTPSPALLHSFARRAFGLFALLIGTLLAAWALGLWPAAAP